MTVVFTSPKLSWDGMLLSSSTFSESVKSATNSSILSLSNLTLKIYLASPNTAPSMYYLIKKIPGEISLPNGSSIYYYSLMFSELVC
jgi:hypothetical protein